MDTRVVAVVVTWNRRDLLEESLAALDAQSHPPARIVVVDNASTDGTTDWLAVEAKAHERWDVVTLRSNTGGAGGFAVGLEQALTHEPDLVWMLDDDTIPTRTAAAELVAAWTSYSAVRRPAVLASRVVWTDGRDHPMNTPRAKPGATRAERHAAAAIGCVPIRSASFVSIMCDAQVVRDRGLPVADYFLWNDDFEYSTRLIRGNVGLSVPASVVEHKTKVFGSTDADPGERFFYEVRNKAWMFTRSRSLSLAEKAVYGAATLRRWARTFAASSDRAVLRRGLLRGLRTGLLTAPRPNDAVLAPAGWSRETRADAPRVLPPGQPFSLLVSTYWNDDPGYLREAFHSSVQQQFRRPGEVVLVQDGPVPPELAAEIAHLAETSPVPVRHVVIDANLGLGPALDRGLQACRHEIVARMDADDVSVPDRFVKQLPVIEAGADIVGSGLTEFGEHVGDVVGRRTPPTDPDEIRRVIRFRDPFNHPTVVYRKSAVQAAGGYTDMALMEDYLLFTRMVDGGARPANLAEPLVNYRVGAGAYARRGGTGLLRSELALQRRFRDLGITTRRQYARNVLVRGGYRLVPEAVRKTAYRALIANRGGDHAEGEAAHGNKEQ
ncbi:glycosyltransferase family 2 protein [Nocardioides iriomotensis]|uniref:Glycosyltransferase n=1 Tax=Nocardioides iriomotensis TaxID=715784 RepID=A0A4Q5J2P3_9ACTN|nr:glycosyltransferase [Nocardioides iriomotensis]RYU12822.1 glycosyltransferase [Nocardioides iriomotensis]